MLMWVLIVVLLVLALGGLPTWGPAPGWHQWGYGPSGVLGLVVVVLLILVLLGRL